MLVVMLRKQPLRPGPDNVPARRQLATPAGKRYMSGAGSSQHFEQQRLEHRVKPRHAADADAAQRVAVIGVAQGQVQSSSPAAGRCAAASIETPSSGRLRPPSRRRRKRTRAFKPARRNLDQPLGQLDRGRVRRAERRDVRHAIELLANRRIEPRMPMPVDVAPQAADAVEIRAAVDVDTACSLRPAR